MEIVRYDNNRRVWDIIIDIANNKKINIICLGFVGRKGPKKDYMI